MWRAVFLVIFVFIAGCEALKQPDPNMVLRPEIKAITDPRSLIERIKEVRLHKTSTGVLIFAIGQASRHGYSQTELVLVNETKPEDGILVYEFRAMEPESQESLNSLGPSEPLAAHTVSNARLFRVNGIKVIGQKNAKLLMLND